MSHQPCLPVPRSGRRRRKRDADNGGGGGEDGESGTAAAVPPSTISDLAEFDAAAYLESVRRQARGLPDVFVGSSRPTSGDADGDATKDGKDEARPSKKKKGGGGDGDGNDDDFVPIDGSAATLHALLSPRLSLPPPPTPAHLPARALDWVTDALADFETLRSYLDECKRNGIGGVKDGKGTRERRPVPTMKDRGGWHEFCLGRDEAMGNAGGYFDDDSDDDDGANDADAANNGAKHDDDKHGSSVSEANPPEKDEPWSRGIPHSGHTPTTSLLLQFDQTLVRRLLSHHGHFLSEGWTLTPRRSAWMYGLLSRLEKPVHRDDAATLREVLRECCRRRAELDGTKLRGGEGEEGTKGKEEEEQTLAALNVLIAVVGVCFGQGGGAEELFSTSAVTAKK